MPPLTARCRLKRSVMLSGANPLRGRLKRWCRLQRIKRGTGVPPVSSEHGRDAHATTDPTSGLFRRPLRSTRRFQGCVGPAGFAPLRMTSIGTRFRRALSLVFCCHCEERSDEAIQLKFQLDGRARLRRARNDKSNGATTQLGAGAAHRPRKGRRSWSRLALKERLYCVPKVRREVLRPPW